tara:strand:+ start:56478 stop:56942 length:465 start_codon:yes stop_codon:yes gene_type:complete
MKIFGTLLPHLKTETILDERTRQSNFINHECKITYIGWFGILFLLNRSKSFPRENEISKMDKDQLKHTLRDIAIAMSGDHTKIHTMPNRLSILAEIVAMERVVFYLMNKYDIAPQIVVDAFKEVRDNPEACDEATSAHLVKYNLLDEAKVENES